MTPHLLILWTAALAHAPAEPTSGRVEPGQVRRVVLHESARAEPGSVVIGLDRPERLGEGQGAVARIRIGEVVLEKRLGFADPDATWQVMIPAGSPLILEIVAAAANPSPIDFRALFTPISEGQGVAFEYEPNDDHASAQPIALQSTVYAAADDRPEYPERLAFQDDESTSGRDWYRFEFDSSTPKLLHVGIEFIDRDVPPDVRIHRLDPATGKVVEFLDGIDPQSLQRERPPRPGANKFTTRVLSKAGRYFIEVDARHPDYQLRTKLFDVPPYLKPGDPTDPASLAAAAAKAIPPALDFQLLAGDSWHANTPRRGHATDRVANPHHETSTCIACHPTHFTTQSALAARRQGYRIEQPFALAFLTERLYNNPVPLHGFPDAVWARMIPAPANVLGRLSTMLMDYENQVAGRPRNDTHRAIGEFLRLYYDGRTELPPDETNGNNPISRYKVAGDSWRQLDELVHRTNDVRFAQTRNLVADLAASGRPDNTRDLAAQTIALATIDPIRRRSLIDANVRRLLELQRPDGHWSPKFEPDYPHAAMQTGESLVALRLAGLPVDHPAILKGAAALLREQADFGAWFDPSKYEQFRTPFRESQWALIALSTLFPGPGARGWDAPLGPIGSRIDRSSDSSTIRDLERIWDDPAPAVLDDAIALSRHPNPQVRLAACAALGRIGRTEAIAPLAAALGDPSKLVRRAAAAAVRVVGNRLAANAPPGRSLETNPWLSAIAEALRSDEARTARAAGRIFVAHFRELASEPRVADALLDAFRHADPMVRMAAVKGLWRLWYWQADPTIRGRVEDRLIESLAVDEHPWVRRNVIEALYIIGDENVRYLYKNWVPSLPSQPLRDRVAQAQHGETARLVDKYVQVLRHGSRSSRLGVLEAIARFHERPGGQGRVGNDTEPMLAYDEAVPKLVGALLEGTSDPDAAIRGLSLEALIAVRESRDPAIGVRVAALRADPEPTVRDWAATRSKEFPLRVERGESSAAFLGVVDRLFESNRDEAIVVALDLLGRAGPAKQSEADRSPRIISALSSPNASVRAAAIRALSEFPGSTRDDAVRRVAAKSAEAENPEERSAAVRLGLDVAGTVPDRILRRALADESPPHRLAILATIGSRPGDFGDLRLVGAISASLTAENGGVREKALQLIQTAPRLLDNPAVEQGLRDVARSDNARQKEIARALLASRGRSSGLDADAELLDLAYFEAKVLPIFNRMGEDGQNCVGCHRSHSILQLQPPRADGRWNPATVRANYRAALRVVDLARPAESLLLGKPTWDAFEEAEAQNDPTKKAHAGGIRFEAGTSPEYQTILDWINGARLPAAAAAGGG
ncbi:MAG: HEAT repeat domain-containing protein [Isosphaeraceae bacterium]|nr:HEAT repeat domain-containing protein [Isosphaeraceae bacterium]